jgi:hypothetical protein
MKGPKSPYQQQKFLVSIPLLDARPKSLEVLVKSTTEKYGEVLIPARVGVISTAGRFNSLEVFAVAFAVASKHDHSLACVVSRSPVPVVLVIADSPGQSILCTKEVYCACLTIAVGEDGGPRALLGRQAVIDLGDRSGHLLPTKLISEVLRQWPRRLVLCFGRFKAKRLLIANIGFNWKDGQRERR